MSACVSSWPSWIRSCRRLDEALAVAGLQSRAANSSFVRPASRISARTGVPQTVNPQPATLNFHPRPDSPLKPLEELFRAKVIHLLVEEELLPPERVQVLYSWQHSGFNVHAGERVPPEAKADLGDLAQYILRNLFSVEKMTLEWPTDRVIYRSRLNAKNPRNRPGCLAKSV